MHDNRKSVLLALVVMAALVIPAGFAGAGEQRTDIEAQVPDVNNVDDLFTTSEDLEVSRVDPEQYNFPLDDMKMPEFEGELRVDPNYAENMKSLGGENLDLDASAFMPVRPMESMITRASDTTNNDDPWNGSKVNVNNGGSQETITGELYYPATDPSGDRGDYIDWYKMELTGVNPTVPGSLKNVTITLDSWDSDEVTLYELTFTDTEYTVDTLDQLEFYLFYIDPFWGFTEMGGKKCWYDDGDDSDGWTYDNDHPDETLDFDNWTFNFRTPMGSTGTEDTDGMANGLSESGWYYLAIRHNVYVTQEAEDRDDYYVDYEFTVSVADDVNNFPLTPSEPDGAANDFNNATSPKPGMPGLTHSGLNHYDWYKFDGINQEHLWNMSVWVNVSLTGWPVDQDLGVTLNDNWMYVYLLWWDRGEDGVYDTEDDGWIVDYKILYYSVVYVDENGDPVPYMQSRFTDTGANNMNLNIWNINNRTDISDNPHPYLEGDGPRTMFVGLLSVPQKFGITQTGGLVQLYADYQCWDKYNIEWSVSEVAPNVPPVISEIIVQSDFEQSESGGYYGSEFTVNVTYTDENNDPPKNIFIIRDEGTGAETNPVDFLELGAPTELSDDDYTDGKEYQIVYTGKELKETPSPHTIKIWAWDKTTHPMKTTKMSIPAYLNDTLIVWDDDPVEIKDPWDGIPTLQEDEPSRLIPLEGFDGAFKDPENRFRGFNIWNATLNDGDGDWDYDYDSDLMHINVSKVDGIWQMEIILKENEWSTEGESIRLRAYDDYSWAQRATRVYVNPINDPPMITGIRIGSITYDVDSSEGRLDNTDPLRPVIHFEDIESAYLIEGELFEFEIIAEDTDRELDRVDQLEFDFENGLSDAWKNFPSVGYNTGIVTLEEGDDGITNDDVKKKNSKMSFSISDRGTDGTIILTAYFKVQNVNDVPTITIPSTTPRTYAQYQSGGIRIKPLADDIDPDDIMLFSVNFDQALEFEGDEIEAIQDQLPNMEVTKDIDWGIDANTGEFWFKPDDQNIWNTASGWVKSMEIKLVFQVTDKAGATATDQILLVLNDLNEEPEAPTEIDSDPDGSVDLYVGDVITFSVDEVTDPDGDVITYKWNFGDGASAEGHEVEHAYSKDGWKTIQMWVFDGQFETEKISIRLEILEKDDAVVDDPTVDPTNPTGTSGDDNTMLFVIAGIAAIVIIIVIVILIFVLRKKEAPAAQQYPMYDQAAMAAYGAQGLPPGQMEQLPPAGAPELPPGQEYAQPEELPPVQPDPYGVPEAAMETPVAAAVPETMEQPEAPAGNACPSCGSAVDPSWFLCPNCKSPLQ